MADAAKKQAQKAEGAISGGFFSFGSTEDKIDSAQESWREAANLFVKEGRLNEASQAWVKTAELRARLKDNYSDTAAAYSDAAKCIRQTDPAKAAIFMEKAIDAFVSGGNTRRASTLSKDLAEMLQLDLQDYEKAIAWSEQGFTWLMLDNATGLACKEKIRAAELQALIGDFFKAGQSFREAAKLYQRTNISRFSVKPTLFCSGICALATLDAPAAKSELDQCVSIDPEFLSSMEGQLCFKLLDFVADKDEEGFDETIKSFSGKTVPLDQWKGTMLSGIYEKLKAEQEDFS